MTLLVALVGLMVGGLGLLGVISPGRVRDSILGLQSEVRFSFGVGVRAVVGVIFILAAPGTHFPTAISVIGWVAVIAALGLLAMGRARLDSLVGWWGRQPIALFRAGFAFTFLFGGFLVYAAI